MTRPVTLLTTGGTIAMAGSGGAVPALDADALAAGVPGVARARELFNKPSVQLSAADALSVARAARDAAAAGDGVVVTCGTDCLEEVATLIDCLSDGPVVVTGAMRHAGAAGADGPANVADAAAVAAQLPRGVVVTFAGDVLAAREARKVDSTSLRAFAAPGRGPLGRVDEGRLVLLREPPPSPGLDPAHLDARVHVAAAALAADGTAVRALAAQADGLVVVVLGAGHTPPAFLEAVREAAAVMPVVACVRPERGHALRSTYAFDGAEGDLHASGALVLAHRSPAAARIALMAAIGAGGGTELLEAF